MSQQKQVLPIAIHLKQLTCIHIYISLPPSLLETGEMKDTIRCCISCILPCGALDVIRIVHSSGRVEEIGGGRTVRADEIMRAYPRHVLHKPPSSSEDGRDGPRAVVLPPNAELQRGKIYFLMPLGRNTSKKEEERSSRRRRRSREGGAPAVEDRARLLVSDQYLSEILSEKASSTQREGRRGRVGVWRPHLETICEITND